jgi:DNA-binding beta-propeller fold protein YncE
MKRVAIAVAAAATAVLALLPGTFAEASVPGGFAVSRIVLGSMALGVAVDSSTGLVYVAEPGTARRQGTVTVIDGASQAVEGSITVPGTPLNIAVDPVTDTVYTSSGNGLTVIDGATSTVTTTVNIASEGGAIAVDPSTDMVYAAIRLPNNVPGIAVIDGATNTVTATIALASTTGLVNSLAVDPATNTIYAGGSQNGTLAAIAGATDAVTKSVQLSSPYGNITGLAVDSGSVYAVDNASNTVDAVNASTLAVTASITGCPYHVLAAAADPAANAVLVTSFGLVSPSPADSTCVIDTAANTVSETFPRGGMAVAADPATGAAYIAALNPVNDIWVATPSSTDELSPMVYGFAGPAFVSSSARFALGVPSSRPLLLSAQPAATITETGALPAGVTMSSSGVFSGTPAAGTAGAYPITVSASNGVGPDSTISLTIDVDQSPAVAAASHLTFRAGRHVRYRITATGFPAPVLREHGRLPRGLAFRARPNGTALIVGKPALGDQGKRYRITVTASNHVGHAATKTVTIRIR